MERIDILGEQYQAYRNLTADLLSETNDVELQRIVEEAATELKSPMALVSLVLDQIQFFKAQVGLPDVLAHTRSTQRDVSFCQFVIKDGEYFEVNDAPNDSRIPQQIVDQYDIHAYLGVPIEINDEIVGSLCVLDTEKRTYSKADFNKLYNLSQLVNQRLEAVTKNRRQKRIDLTHATLKPAINELSSLLLPLEHNIKANNSHLSSIRSFMNLFEHLHLDNKSISPEAKMAFKIAQEANRSLLENHEEIEWTIEDSTNCLSALEHLVSGYQYRKLSSIVTSAQDLCRNATRSVGGFPLPDFLSDPIVIVKENFAIALISNCILQISSEMRNQRLCNGISLTLQEADDSIDLFFRAEGLYSEVLQQISEQLQLLVDDKSNIVGLQACDEKLILRFQTIAF